MDLVLRGIIVGALTVLAGWLARRQETALAAVLVHLPVVSLGVFWAASAAGRIPLELTITRTLLAVPVWLSWVGTSLVLLKLTELPPTVCLGLGLAVWLVAASLWVALLR